MTTDRLRTAYHESGHAVAAWLYGKPLRLVSIRPGQTYAGMTAYHPTAESWAAAFDPSIPTLGQPADLREAIERDVVVSLAGDIAAGYVLRPPGWRPDDPCEAEPPRAALALAELAPRHRELLHNLEADPVRTETDEEAAAGMSYALTGAHEEAAAHVEWLRVVARRLVADNLDRIAALAAALAERTVMDGDAASALIASVRSQGVGDA